MSELIQNQELNFEQYAPITDGIAVRGVQEELRIDVTLNFKLLNECAEATINLLERRSAAGYVPTDEEEKYKKYLYSLLVYRVLYVSDYSKFKKFNIHQRDIKVPFWFALVLGAIGRVHDTMQNVFLEPVCKYNMPDVFSAEELKVYQRHLSSRYPDLIPLVDFPMSKEGSLRYMSIININNVLRGYKDQSHPTYALFSTMVEKITAEEAYNVLFRYDYGNYQEYENRLITGGLTRIVNPAAGG